MSLFLKIITNGLDILILSFVIYKVLGMLKGNRGMQLMKGFALLFAVYFISGWLRLSTVHFLMAKAWAVLVIGLIVLFQPELRSLLEHLGGKSFTSLLGLGRKEPVIRLAEEVSKAVEVFARNKTGALIILQGKTGLREYIATGTKTDSVVSRELLGNIFFKNSPLHDGAAIICDNRLAAAGCIMPLSDNNSLSSSLGTRHRAALGISEVNDCLAVVVSEETGAISLAHKGRLDQNLTLEETEDGIIQFIRGSRKDGEQKRKPLDFIVNNWAYKLLSVALALIIWAMVNFS